MGSLDPVEWRGNQVTAGWGTWDRQSRGPAGQDTSYFLEGRQGRGLGSIAPCGYRRCWQHPPVLLGRGASRQPSQPLAVWPGSAPSWSLTAYQLCGTTVTSACLPM